MEACAVLLAPAGSSAAARRAWCGCGVAGAPDGAVAGVVGIEEKVKGSQSCEPMKPSAVGKRVQTGVICADAAGPP
nr:unnamed protein product [Digitaria exilis]